MSEEHKQKTEKVCLQVYFFNYTKFIQAVLLH